MLGIEGFENGKWLLSDGENIHLDKYGIGKDLCNKTVVSRPAQYTAN